MIMFDILMVILMSVGIFFLLKLRNAVKIVHDARVELKQMLGQFAFDINRAEKALAELKHASKAQINDIEQASKKALNLHDDLEFLMHRGEDIADRLETVSHYGIKQVKNTEKKMANKKNKTDNEKLSQNKYATNLEGLR